MSTWRSTAAIIGKAPWHPEFLRPPASSGPLYAFDAWLFARASALPAPPLGAWETLSYGFVVHVGEAARGGGTVSGASAAIEECRVAGVLAPSHDRADRAYPLSVAAAIAFPRFAELHPELVPILLEPYWLAAGERLSALREIAPGPAGYGLEALTCDALESPEDAHALYVEWTRGTTANDFAELLGRSRTWLERTTFTIVDVVATRERSRAHAHTAPLIFRLPLGQAAGAALCFWLDVIRRAMRPRTRLPSFFWSHDVEEGDALVCLGTPGDDVLSSLWRVGAAAPHENDLTHAEAPPHPSDAPPQDALLADLGPLHAELEAVAALLDGVDARLAAFSSLVSGPAGYR